MTAGANAGPAVLVELVDHTLVVTINRPGARNAIDHAVSRGIAGGMSRAATDPAVRVVILTGSGNVAFCAGADLKALAQGESARPPELDHLGFAGYVRFPLDKPTIAAVNGYALGGGTELCLGSDLVVASRTATFGLPEVTRGLAAGGGGALRLPRQIPPKIAMQMLFTGEQISAQQANAWGLVNLIVEPEDLRSATLDLASRIAANAPLAVQASKRIARRAIEGPPDDHADWESNAAEMARVVRSKDALEGLRAFVDRRAPVWSGR